MLKKLKSKKFYKQLLVSYLLIIVTFFIFSMFIFSGTQNVIKKQTEESLSSDLLMYSKKGDTNFNAILHCADNLNNYLIHQKGVIQNLQPDRSSIQSISGFLNAQTVSNNFIEAILIYNPVTGKMITDFGLFDPEVIYYTYYGDKAMFDSWLGRLQAGGGLPTIEFLDGITTDRAKCKIMEYSYSVNIDKTACSIVYIVNLNQCFSYTTTNFLLLSPDSKLYLGNSQTREIAVHALSELTNTYNSSIPIKHGSQHYMLSIVESQFFKCHFIQIEGYSNYWEYIRKYKTIFWLYLMICIVVCVFMAMYIAKLNYRPVESIISNLPAGYKSGANEFYDIRSYLKEKERDERQFSLKIKNYAQMLTSIGVEHILYNFIDSEELTELRMRYDIGFEYECYFVVIFETCPATKSNTDPNEIYSVSDVGIIVNNVLADIISRGKYYCTETSKGITCIVNTDKSDVEDVNKKIIEAGRIIENKMHLKLNIVISDVCYSVEDIPKAYGECLKSTDSDLNSFLFVNTVFTNKETKDYTFTDTDAELLKLYVVTLNPDNAKNLVRVILNKNMHNFLQKENTACIMYDILMTVLKCSKALVSQATSEFIKISSIEESIDYVDKTIDSVAATYQHESLSSVDMIAYNVCTLIEKEVSNLDLSVSYISNYYCKTTPYISKVFKDVFSISLIEYIQMYRINNSIPYLRDMNCFIKDIAAELGFSNSNTFIRTFKKYVGLSPNEYRKSSFNF